MKKALAKKARKIRHKRIRSRVSGTGKRPRLFVFRSNQHIYVQLIDDTKGKTLVSFSDLKLKKSTKKRVAIAKELVSKAALAAMEMKIEKVVFDRAGYKYHGIVKAVAEAAREQGLKF